MTPSIQHLPFDTTPTSKSQEPFLYKLKSGFAKFISRRRHSSIVDTFKPNKPQYSPTRQDSFASDHEQDDEDDEQDSSSDTQISSEPRYSTCYSKDDQFERTRYNSKISNGQAQHNRRPSAVSIQSPPSILVNRSPTPSSHHRHTSSLQNASIISVPGSNGKPAHYHHSRHYSHISYTSASNMTVNSEDLTAKEFADMAGIKIIPDDDTSQHEDATDDTQSSILVTNRHQPISSASSIVTPAGQRPSYFSYHAGDENDWSVGSMHSQQSGSAAKIWDTEFWKRPFEESAVNPTLRKHRSALLQHRQTLSLPPPLPSSKIHGQHVKSKSTVDLPIVHELKRIHSNTSGGDPQVIRKGRFEIQLQSNCT